MTYRNNQYLKLEIGLEEISKIEIEIDERNREIIEDLDIIGDMPNIIIGYGEKVDYNNIFTSVKILITDQKAIKKNEYIPEHIEDIIVYGYKYKNDRKDKERLKKGLENGEIVNRMIYKRTLAEDKRKCEKEIIEFMKRNEINVNYINETGKTILMNACINGLENVCLEVIKRREYEILINKHDIRGQIILHQAYDYGMFKLTEKLMENKRININYPDRQFGETILFKACRKRDKRNIEKILKRGIDVMIPNNNGLMALDVAIMYDIESIAFKIIKRIEEEEKTRGIEYNYETALILSCQELAMENVAIKLIKKRNIDVNINKTIRYLGLYTSDTPLTIACTYNRKKIVSELLKREDIEIHKPNKEGETAYSIISKSSLDYDRLLHYKSFTKIEKERKEILKMIIKKM